jgi:predicted GNAT family N-acyltransferase
LSADRRLTLTVRPAHDAAEIVATQQLRVRVFCEEQGVEAELDGPDGEATHIVALYECGVVATCCTPSAGPRGSTPPPAMRSRTRASAKKRGIEQVRMRKPLVEEPR